MQRIVGFAAEGNFFDDDTVAFAVVSIGSLFRIAAAYIDAKIRRVG